ncbi:hypothetical protein PF005_g24046 [Phytophthora fragariae]|uniref:ISXO2-like transposase domain-containing protein n=1 Tax=Phytophthora fragariae TaxID=53985 RepID=A0A6A3QED6_9STRA|nr:hypothetical protein PF009_g26090 [Phytophthora fragariae]KAE8979871.1 hypothetical protein PF011_g22669 [Phytophthora fragariae]KAE9074699.1 hypothetical protein PF007_g25304 [Phytophthora fragariae]KAE9098985.1 hypothetical protein PF006_g23237 [Phytophthora fragariae]KAE9178522.1 hypothetical protein PF005_g24046 [Phytophthora fragariae]
MAPVEYDVVVDADTYSFAAAMLACSSEEGAIAWVMKHHWRCNRATCRTERTIRTQSFFARTSAPLSKLIKILFFWAHGAHVTEATQHVQLSRKTAGQWYQYARDICSAEMLRCDMKTKSLKKKQKYNRGTKHPDYWVFGGVGRTTNKWFAKVVYDDRTKPNLSRSIKVHIKPGVVARKGTLHTLENYRALAGMRYSHQWVNHSKNFVDPTTGVHINKIEGVWEVKIKVRMKSERGVRKNFVPGYLDECLWRSW